MYTKIHRWHEEITDDVAELELDEAEETIRDEDLELEELVGHKIRGVISDDD